MESGLTVANLWKPAGARFTLQATQNVYPIELVTERSIPSSVLYQWIVAKSSRSFCVLARRADEELS